MDSILHFFASFRRGGYGRPAFLNYGQHVLGWARGSAAEERPVRPNRSAWDKTR